MTDPAYIQSLIDLNKESSKSIQIGNKKDRFLYPFFPTTVVDNFYEDPDVVREYALGQEFFKGNRGSWPGLRTELLHTLNKDLFSVFSKKMLFILQEYGFTEFTELQTGFQTIDESYGRGWVHDDDPKLNLAGIVYLNPNPPPGTGTTIYADQPDFNGEAYTEMFMNDVLVSSPEERAQFAKYREDQLKHFTPTIEVDNIYNRCVMFDSRCWHSADRFFGKDLQDSRLTQVFFIKAI